MKKAILSTTKDICPSCNNDDLGDNEGINLSDNPKYQFQFYYTCPKCKQKIKRYWSSNK